MAAKKKIDPIKQREKRAKIAAIAGVLLLVLVAAFEVPKMLALMNKKPAVPPPAAVAAPAPGTVGGLPDVSGTPTTTTPSGELADTDVPPAASGGGQLVSFDVFETKDPFRPQVTNAAPAGSSAPAPATGATGGTSTSPPGASTGPSTGPSTQPATTRTPTPPTVSTPATVVPAGASSTPSPTTPAPVPARTVSISVNGAVSRVGRDGTFPSGTPVFRLVSWTKGEARIGIVGGTYATGGPTLTLVLGKPVTLQNTSDGQRYKLILISTP